MANSKTAPNQKKNQNTASDWAKAIDSAIATSNVAMAFSDLDGRLIYVNGAFLRMWGYSAAKEVIWKRVVDFWMVEDRVFTVIDTLRKRNSWEGELVGRRKDGSAFDARLSASMVRNEDNKPVCMMGVFEDITARKTMEAALRKSEESHRSLVANIPAVVFQLSPSGFIQYVSPRAALYGYKAADLVGKHLSKTTLISELPRALKALNIAVKGKRVQNFEITQLDSKGKAIPMEISMSPVKEDGRVTAVQGVMTDIADRKRAGNALRESEEKFRLAFENAKDAIFWADPETGRIINCNKAAESLLEKKKKDIIGQSQTGLHPPEKKLFYAEKFKKHVEERGSIDDEAEVVSRSGRIIPVHITASVTMLGKKQVMQGIFRDITERKKAEAALQESEQMWRSLVQNLPDIVMTVSRNGTLLAINRTVRGIKMGDAIGRSIYEYIAPEYHELVGKTLDIAFRTGRPQAYEILGTGPEGPKTAWYETRVVPVFRDKTVIAVMQISRDITERRKTEAELIQAQRLVSIGHLAAGVAHEVNNPLSALLGEIQWLEKKTKDKKVIRSLKFIEKVSERISNIVNNLLAFSRETAVKARAEANINSLVNRTLSLMERRFKLTNIKIVKKFDNNLPRIIVNKGQIEQVFTNIMLNSLDAMAGGGRLAISTKLDRPRNAIEVTFADSGVGIAKENLPRVFDPFFSTKPADRGTGLGLSVSHGIIKNHGGSIDIISKVNKGTKVTIRLPMKKGGKK